MSKVTVDYTELSRALSSLRERGESAMAAVSPSIAEVLVSGVQEEFLTEGRGRWDPLADSTIKKRRQRQPSGAITILQDTGVLAASITPFADAMIAEAFSNVPYGGYHTSKRPRRVIPLRDFTDIDMAVALEEAEELVVEAVLRGAA